MKRFAIVGIGLVVCVAGTVMTLAGGTDERRFGATGLVREVRQATRDFFDPNAAMAAGYGSAGSCVSGPQEGAMGIHFPNGTLVGDGELDAQHPEILIYEQRGGRLRLLGVEFLVLAADWDAKQIGPPVLMGQHFQVRQQPEPLRSASVLRAARLGVARQPARDVRRLEPDGLVRGVHGGQRGHAAH